MYGRCMDLFFSCCKSKKSGSPRKVSQSSASLLELQVQPAQPELEKISSEIAVDIQAYLAQKNSNSDGSKSPGEAYLITKKMLPELSADLRVKDKLCQQKRAELKRLQPGFPEYEALEAALKLAEEACKKAEKILLEKMKDHAAYLSNFEDEDVALVSPQNKYQ